MLPFDCVVVTKRLRFVNHQKIYKNMALRSGVFIIVVTTYFILKWLY